jgi:transposase
MLNPIHVQPSVGNVHDVAVAEELLSAIPINGSPVLADKAYSSFRLREHIAARHADYCIPPKLNESEPWFCDWWRYKEHHLVECFFLKLNEYRRVATRYDKHACRYLGFVHLACIRILLA